MQLFQILELKPHEKNKWSLLSILPRQKQTKFMLPKQAHGSPMIKALHALCQALSPSEFTRISNCEVAKDAWQILETTYADTKLVKSAKLQMLISKFDEIKMLEEETFGEFYTKISDLRNSMVSLGKQISDVKLIRKILRSLPERFRIKVTTI
jgi:hypothetical protein